MEEKSPPLQKSAKAEVVSEGGEETLPKSAWLVNAEEVGGVEEEIQTGRYFLNHLATHQLS